MATKQWKPMNELQRFGVLDGVLTYLRARVVIDHQCCPTYSVDSAWPVCMSGQSAIDNE